MSLREALDNTWGKIIMVALPMLIAGFIIGITIREKVAQLEIDVAEVRASQVTREELRPALDGILRELTGLREDLRALRPPR